MGLRRSFLMALDALLIGGDKRNGAPVQARVREGRIYQRTISAVHRLNQASPRLVALLTRLFISTRRLPIRGDNLQLLGYGSGATVLLWPGSSGSRVIKVFRRSFGRSLPELVALAGEYRRKYLWVRRWYAHPEFDLVPEMDFLIVHGVLLSQPAAVAFQTCIPQPHQDLATWTREEVAGAAGGDESLGRQLQFFTERTLEAFDEGGECLDLVGRGNLVLTGPPGRRSLVIIDTGLFDLAGLESRAPARYRALLLEIEKLRSWRHHFRQEQKA